MLYIYSASSFTNKIDESAREILQK